MAKKIPFFGIWKYTAGSTGSRPKQHENVLFFLNNQPDALIIRIYPVIKLYMFRASSLPIIRSSPLIFGTGKFHADF